MIYSNSSQINSKSNLKTGKKTQSRVALTDLVWPSIVFNEFNQFSKEYGLNWGEPLLENDLEDQLEAKNNLSYKDYVLSPSDYFMGCQTMLTSEKAALAKVR